MSKLKQKWLQLEAGKAVIGITMLIAVLVAISILLPKTKWCFFIVITPMAIGAAGEKWILPDCKPQKATQTFLWIVTGLSILMGIADRLSFDALHVLFSLIAVNSFTFTTVAFFIAISSPLCRLIERQTIRNGNLETRDIVYWIKNTFITNFSGWIALFGVVKFTLLHSGIATIAPLSFDYGNPALCLIAQTITFIVVGYAVQQQKSQKTLKMKFENTGKWDDDIEKDFSLSSVAQITNSAWLFTVGFTLVLFVAYLWNYANLQGANSVRWVDIIIVFATTLPFFASCAFQIEHPFVFFPSFVFGTSALYVAYIFYILFVWSLSVALIALPITLIAIHICLVYIIIKKRIVEFNPTLFSIAYICAGIASFSIAAMPK